MLSVAPDAAADDIKKAFRREIARYHPDKVQHLGKEFQEMASGIAADLTEAYRILMDPALRAKYDDELRGTPVAQAPVTTAPPPSSESPPPASEPRPASAASPGAHTPPAGARSAVGIDFVRRVTLAKLREAVQEVLVGAEPLTAPIFDIAVVATGKRGLFKKAEESVCLLVKFVAEVDPGAVAHYWPAAARVKAPGATGCVLMLAGPAMSHAKELAAAVTEQRRKTRSGGGPVLVPVDVRDWDALFPPETPGAVRALIQRLKDEKR